MSDGSLIRASDSMLLVIDVQPGFLARLAIEEAERIVDRIAWLARVATRLDIPIVATEEEPDRNGSTDATVAAALPTGASVHRKNVFGLADQRDIMAAVERLARRTAVLVGCETDVCVAHSAIGLVERGYRTVVLADATGSPGDGHASGLERIRLADAMVTTTKGIYYEWVRTLETAYEVEGAVPPPSGLDL